MLMLSLVPRPSPATFLATYMTFERSVRVSKVTYAAENGAGDGLGMRLPVQVSTSECQEGSRYLGLGHQGAGLQSRC